MAISSVKAAERIAPTLADAHATAAKPLSPQESASVVATVETDPVTNMPLPPRFPWLSRLSAQLESVAKQKPLFASAPLLGDNLDQAV